MINTTRSIGINKRPRPALSVYVGIEVNLILSIFMTVLYWLLLLPVTPLNFLFTAPPLVVVIFLNVIDKK